jgi:hypothetical protein
MIENNDRKEIIKSSLSAPVKEILTDIADMGLIEIIEKITKEENFLKGIPVIKWFFLANDIRNIIQGAFFLQKYANFIGPVNEAMKDDIMNDEKLIKIFSDKKIFSKVIDQTIISLDRYQTIQKAKILGLLFVETFKNNHFSFKEYNTLIFSIDNIHPLIGIECLKSFYDYKNELKNEENSEKKDRIYEKYSFLDFSPLVNTCLLRLPHGGMFLDNPGGAFINDLGYRFYELVVSKAEN